jgi:hypothetical protein
LCSAMVVAELVSAREFFLLAAREYEATAAAA